MALPIPFPNDALCVLNALDESSITINALNPGYVETWADQSDNGFDFSEDGSHPDYNPPPHEVVFNGVSDYLYNPSQLLPATGDFTVAVRVARNATKNNHTIFSGWQNAGGDGLWTLHISSDALRFDIYRTPASGGTLIAQGPAMTLGQYYNVVVIRSGRVFSLYVDGVHEDSISYSPAIQSRPAIIGARWSAYPSINSVTYANIGIQRFGVWSQAYSGSDLTKINQFMTTGRMGGVPLPLMMGMI